MARPSKPLALVEGHRTKDEIKTRRDAEKSMLTGAQMKISFSAKDHPAAAKEFRRIKKLLAEIKKDDDLYAQIICTYCLLVEECEQIKDIRNQFVESKYELERDYRDGLTGDPDTDGMKASEYYRLLAKLSGSIIDCDKQLMAKRKMILDISRENIMTVQSALRSIPKKPEEKKPTGMGAFMQKRAKSGE